MCYRIIHRKLSMLLTNVTAVNLILKKNLLKLCLNLEEALICSDRKYNNEHGGKLLILSIQKMFIHVHNECFISIVTY